MHPEEAGIESQAEDDLRERRKEREQRQSAVRRGPEMVREQRDQEEREPPGQDVREAVERRLSGQPADLRDEGRG
jgi:hypothetical protein